MAQIQVIEDGACTYPLPDPAWNYAALWESLQVANAELNRLIQYTAEIEDATPESDRAIGIQIEAIAATIAESLKTIKRS